MTTAELEHRVAMIEQDLAALKRQLGSASKHPVHWTEQIAGTFSSPEDQAAFKEAMRYGRKWRQSQRPGRGKRNQSKKK